MKRLKNARCVGLRLIEDLDSLSRRMLWGGTLSAYKNYALDQDNYCETAKKLIIIRAPWVSNDMRHLLVISSILTLLRK